MRDLSKTSRTLLIFVCVIFWGLFLKVVLDRFSHPPKKVQVIQQEDFFQPQRLAPPVKTIYFETYVTHRYPTVVVHHQEVFVGNLPLRNSF